MKSSLEIKPTLHFSFFCKVMETKMCKVFDSDQLRQFFLYNQHQGQLNQLIQNEIKTVHRILTRKHKHTGEKFLRLWTHTRCSGRRAGCCVIVNHLLGSQPAKQSQFFKPHPPPSTHLHPIKLHTGFRSTRINTDPYKTYGRF